MKKKMMRKQSPTGHASVSGRTAGGKKMKPSVLAQAEAEALAGVTDERGPKAKGLAQLFPGRVRIITLDAESSRRRNARYDFEVKLGLDEIEPEDIAMLRATMNLSDAMIDAAYTMRKRWGRGWGRSCAGPVCTGTGACCRCRAAMSC